MAQIVSLIPQGIFTKPDTFGSVARWLGFQGTPRDTIIMHVDIVDSTKLVTRDLMAAHAKIQLLYSRICKVSKLWKGMVREMRGDAAVIEFPSAADAVSAAQHIQSTSFMANNTRFGIVEPRLRIGISKGPVIVGDNTVTGEAVIIAQRLEQLAKPGEILVDGKTMQALEPCPDLKLELQSLEILKGFSAVTKIFRAVFTPHLVLSAN